MGVGNGSCAKMANAYAAGRAGEGIDGPGGGVYASEATLYRQWLWGAMSGSSMATGKGFATDPEGIEGWVLKYCQDHPAASIVNATQAAFSQLAK